MKSLFVESKAIKSNQPVRIPGDKSISHRALMVASLFDNETRITNLNMGSAVTVLKDLYRVLEIPLELNSSGEATVGYLNPELLKGKEIYLNAGPSSCVARFMIGILSGLNVSCTIDGDETLRARPMDFAVEPLVELGANIQYLEKEGFLPVKIRPGRMQDGSVRLKVESAQASSAVFMAALTAKIKVEVFFKSHSRDHTQKLLEHLGCEYSKDSEKYILDGRKELKPLKEYHVPSDPSLAAFPVAAHLIQKRNTPLLIKNVCLNPTRTGILELFKRMGASIEFKNVKTNCGEEVGDILVAPLEKTLTPCDIGGGELIHSMIDEIPLAAAVASSIEGKTTITNAAELEFKETNRLLTTKAMLNEFGVEVQLIPGGMTIEGTSQIKANQIDSHKDHRISMAAAVLALKSVLPVEIIHGTCSDTSFPGFAREMKNAGFSIKECQ